MNNQFPIISVPDTAAQAPENMGTKYKFWYRNSDRQDYLFKAARDNTGEDWAEKLAAELCQLIHLPHVEYELATFQNKPGSISRSMLPQNQNAILLHGNEILAIHVSNYPAETRFRNSEHTIELIRQAIDLPNVQPPYNWPLPEGITSAMDVFVGYIMFDTWISNGDRHHENWGFIQLNNINYLAPTYDHGSCLGRSLLDQKRANILANGSVENYVKKSRSAIYATVNDKTALLNFEVFEQLAQIYPNAARRWLQILSQVKSDDIMGILARVPSTRLSPLALDFTDQILRANQQRLLTLRESLS
jgi:hypothetical protein